MTSAAYRASAAVPVALLALLCSCTARAQDAMLFASDEPLEIRLEAPLRAIFADDDEREFQESRLAVAGSDGQPLSLDLGVRLRGKSRAEACEFPPLLLNFKKEQPDGSPFAGEDRLKLVTHCRSNPDHDGYVQLERQIYLVLNRLTDASLRTRPVTITYFDSSRGREVGTRPGFLIEDEERFAERSGLTVVSAERVDRESYDDGALAMLDVFQYFIGNTDWSALQGPAGDTCCHNVVPFARSDGVLIPVAYDFDASGLVNAPYALPAEQLPIQSVRNRLYRGRCRELAALEPVFEKFKAERAEITALFDTASGLPQRRADSAREYIDEFYALLDDDARMDRAFRINCSR